MFRTGDDGSDGGERGLLLKARAVIEEELGRLQPRKWLAEACANAFPHLALPRVRTRILRAGGVKIGARSLVFGDFRVTGRPDCLDLVSIGADSFITGPLFVDVGAEVEIGDRVYIGQHVILLTVNHSIGGPEQRCGPCEVAPVVIGDGAWLGCRAMILPGVTVGRGSVVGAGAIVTRDVPPDTLVAGVPARVVRELEPEAPSHVRPRPAYLAVGT